MPLKNQAITVSVIAWDTANNMGKTGDAANITVRGVGDGVEFTPSAPTISEVDATNLPGVYSVSLIASENNYNFVTLGGVSATSDVVIIPLSWANEREAGAGAITWTYTITDGTDPLEGVDVWVTSDVAGTDVLASGTTNSSGVVTFYLDAGTVYVWSQKSGYTFTNPDTEVVS